MASRKKTTTTKKRTNGGRATIRDVMTAVDGLNERIDGTHQRIDESIATGQRLSEQMTELHDSLHSLREATNERLHGMEADVAVIKRPWILLASGWSKALAVGGAAAAIGGTVGRLELWRFLGF